VCPGVGMKRTPVTSADLLADRAGDEASEERLLFGRPPATSIRSIKRPTLTDGDARAIAAEVQDVIAAAPLLRGRAQLAARSANWSTVLNGTTEAFFVAYPLSSGRGFLPEETDMARKVAILGSTAAVELFGDEDPVDHTIRINHLAFQGGRRAVDQGADNGWLGPR
jgi:hypothetical protein